MTTSSVCLTTRPPYKAKLVFQTRLSGGVRLRRSSLWAQENIADFPQEGQSILFFGVLALILAGVWSLDRIPLDALPDISDVQVIIHTEWMGQPPNLIEDQVTYPIVTAMLAAPHVKAVRAQTMPNDSYVFVVFKDGTDIYWARSRVLESSSRLQASFRPV